MANDIQSGPPEPQPLLADARPGQNRNTGSGGRSAPGKPLTSTSVTSNATLDPAKAGTNIAS
jgi:hypothetical protein